jgi:polyphosphate kinase
VRGICCLRPGIEGVSENIRVSSVVGRFLEHSRIYYFGNDGKPEVFIGSADLMPRNLNSRVEVLAPILEPKLVKRVRDEIFGVYLRDNAKTRRMNSDGTYERVRPAEEEPTVNAQEELRSLGTDIVRKRKRKGTPHRRKSTRKKV